MCKIKRLKINKTLWDSEGVGGTTKSKQTRYQLFYWEY
jgi:hypothetical protein